MADTTDSFHHEDTQIVENCSCSAGDYHRKCLKELCKICRKFIKPKDPCFEIDKHVEDLGNIHGIDFSKYMIDIQRPRYCFTCFGGLNDYKKRGTVPT